LVASGLILGTYAIVGMNPEYWYALLGASGALLVYHTDRAFFTAREDADNAPHRIAWYRHHRSYLVVSSVVATICAIWSATHIHTEVLLAGSVLGLAGILYSIPLPFTSLRLKDVQVLKTLLIVSCWVIGGVILPVWSTVPVQAALFLAGYKFLYVIPNVLMAEWVDRSGDAQYGIQSTGSRMSLSSIRMISLACLLAAFIILWIWSRTGQPVDLLYIDSIGLAGMVAMILFKKDWTSKHIIALDMFVGFPMLTWVFWVWIM